MYYLHDLFLVVLERVALLFGDAVLGEEELSDDVAAVLASSKEKLFDTETP
jgi:hypothetical protein